MKIKAKKDLFLDGTDKRLFTEGKIYTVLSTDSHYQDSSILDNNNFNHIVNNDFIRANFIKVR